MHTPAAYVAGHRRVRDVYSAIGKNADQEAPMRLQKVTHAIAAAAVVVATAGSSPDAQEAVARDLAELLATLREPKLPLPKKQALVRQRYSGTVEVFEVHTTVPSHVGPDRVNDVLGLDKPSMRIMVDVGASSPSPMYLAFETTDTERAKKLRKGDRVTLSGKLVKFVQHRDGYSRQPDEWLIFGDVVIEPGLN